MYVCNTYIFGDTPAAHTHTRVHMSAQQQACGATPESSILLRTTYKYKKQPRRKILDPDRVKG